MYTKPFYDKPFETEHVEVVDAAGKPFLIVPLDLAFRQKLRHRSVIACLRNMQGDVFLHKRPSFETKDHAGVWGFSASGRVFAGESCYEAALRRLEEELRITDLELSEVGRLLPSSLTEHTETVVFLSTKTSAIPRNMKDGVFVDREEIMAILRDFPHMVTPDFHLAIPHIFPET